MVNYLHNARSVGLALAVLLAAGAFFAPHTAHAQWAQGDACTTANKVYASETDSRASLICDGANLQYYVRGLGSPLAVGIGTNTPISRFMVAPPASEAIANLAVITADACGTVKPVISTGAVATNATNTFTLPTASHAGCCMDVINVDAEGDIITLDDNTNFKTAGAANIALNQYDMVRVCSNGTFWFQAEDKVAAAGSVPISSLTVATGTNTINNAAYAQEWQWNTLAGATALKLSSTSTAAAGNLQRMFEIALSGANTTATQTTYGMTVSNTHTGATATNYGIDVTATSGGTATANYGIRSTVSGALAGHAVRGVASGVQDVWGVYGSATGGNTSNVGVYGFTDSVGGGSSYAGQFVNSNATGNSIGLYSQGAALIAPYGQTIASAAGAEFTTATFTAPTITLTGSTGVTSQMDSYLFSVPTITDASAVTVTGAATMTVAGVPVKAGSVTLTNAYGLKINSNATAATNAYGLHVTAPTGATNNYAASFATGNVGIGTAAPGFSLDVTGVIRAQGGTILGNESTVTTCNAGLATLLRLNTVSGIVEACDGAGGWVPMLTDPAGSTGQIQYNNAGAFGADANLLWDATRKFIVTPPASEAIVHNTTTITANACGSLKQIMVGTVGVNNGNATTNTTNTLTAPAAANSGCCMDVVNVETGTDVITLDTNADFITGVGADITLAAGDGVRVCSNGAEWYQGSAVSSLASAGSSIDGLSDGFTDYTTEHNIIMGRASAAALTAGAQFNMFIGEGSGAAVNNASADYNTALGYTALAALTSGTRNTALGQAALAATNTGGYNVAVGHNALTNNNGGQSNVAVGTYALINTNANNNIAIGFQAGDLITSGTGNIIIGYDVDPPANNSTNHLNIGGTIFGDVSTDNVRIGGSGAVGAGPLLVQPPASNQAIVNNITTITADGCGSIKPIMVGTVGVNDGSVTTNTTDTFTTPAAGNAGCCMEVVNVETGTDTITLDTNANFITGLGTDIVIAAGDAVKVCSNGSKWYQGAAVSSLAASVTPETIPLTDLTDAYMDYTASAGRGLIGTGVGATIFAGANNNLFVGPFAGSTGTSIAMDNNTALGVEALDTLDTGANNTAVGYQASYGLSSGSGNTAVGYSALWSGTSNSNNTAVGYSALGNTTASNNTAVGRQALGSVSTGGENVGIGESAGYAGTAITTGAQNTFVGTQSQASGQYSNATAIGYGAIVTGSNYIQLGNASVTRVYFGTGAGTPVLTAGMYVTASDMRLKKDIQDSDLGLDFIENLRPVSYRFKQGAGSELLRYGFIAQEVEKSLGDRATGIVTRDDNELKTYALSYTDMIAPVVKAVQELNAKNSALVVENASLKAEINLIQTQVKGMDDLRRDINGLKAHTGYGINKAQMGFMMMLSAAGAAGLVIVCGAVMRRRKRG